MTWSLAKIQVYTPVHGCISRSVDAKYNNRVLQLSSQWKYLFLTILHLPTSQHETCAHYQKLNQPPWPPSFQVKCTILLANGVVLWGWNIIQGNCADAFRKKNYCYTTSRNFRRHATFALLLINAGKCLIHLITFCYVCAFFYPIINGLKGPIEEMYVHK